MRTAYKVWSGIAVGVFCVVAAVDLTAGTTSVAPVASTFAASPATSAPAGRPSVTIDVAAAPAPVAVVTGPVTKIVDGDTLEVAGERVRVLGIDSCDAGTVAGRQATGRAQALLGGRTVALREQPGIDRDPSGRELRYVEVDGRDFGLAMVNHPDTGVYQGRQDASPSYLAQLRAADTDGRSCGGPTASGSSGSAGGSSRPATSRPRTSAGVPAVGSTRTEAPGGTYANCTAARAAGVTPLLRGQRGYSSSLDRDGDGVACE